MNTTQPQAGPTTAHTLRIPLSTSGSEIIDNDGIVLCDLDDRHRNSPFAPNKGVELARFIVTACNSHDRLVEALKAEHEAYMDIAESNAHGRSCATCELLAEIEGQ